MGLPADCFIPRKVRGQDLGPDSWRRNV